MPKAKPQTEYTQSQKAKVTLLEGVKTILEQKTIDISELSKILPKINKDLKETLIYKVSEKEFQLKIEIVKLLKKLLAHNTITSSLDPQQLQELTNFTYLICKSTAQTTQFQSELVNYLEQYFIGLDKFVSITKEGVFFRKDQDGAYTIPAGTADIAIIVRDEKGNIVAQYIIECDGSSHTDTEKDQKRDAYCKSHATGYLCVKHEDKGLTDVLATIILELKKFKDQVNALPFVQQQRDEARKTYAKDREETKVSQKAINQFYPLQEAQQEALATEEDLDRSSTQCKPGSKSKSNQARKKEKASARSEALDLEALDREKARAEEEKKIINDLLDLAEEMKFGEFLERTLAISQKAQKISLDQHLLEIAKPYVLTLLRTGYKNPVLFNEELWSELAKIKTVTIKDLDDKMSIANGIAIGIAEPHTSQKTPDFWQLTAKILGTDFKTSVTHTHRHRDCLQYCCANDFSGLFKHLLAEEVWTARDEKLLLDLLKQCYAFGKGLEIVKILLEKINELKIQTEVPTLSRSALIASIYNNLPFLKLLLEEETFKTNSSFLLNEKDESQNNFNALLDATQFGYTEIVILLLNQPEVDVNAKTRDGFTALHLACQYGHEGIAELLLQHADIDVNSRTTGGCTALRIAVENNNLDIVKLLLKNEKIDVNAKLEDGSTTLMIAAESGHTEILESLLKHKDINVNAQETDGYTALMMATKHRHTEIVKSLLQHQGINVNAQETDGYTALMIATTFNYTEIVKSLLQHKGIDVDVKNNDSSTALSTALMMAAMFGHTEIVELLLRHKDINVNLKGLSDYTALMMAAESGHTEIVQLLLQHTGIDVNVQNNDGSTALMMAAESGHTEIVKSLLQHTGIDVDLQTKDGCTALKMASKNRHKEIVESLLQYKGIDVNAQSNTGPAQALADTQIIERLTEQHKAPISHIAPAQSVQLKKPRTR